MSKMSKFDLSCSRPLLHGAFALATCVAALPVRADPSAYVVNLFQQFGTVNLTTGAFSSVGPGLPEGVSGLVAGAPGALLTLSFTGNLDAIDVATGATTVVGATGLGDNANTLAKLGSTLYATDLANNLYTLNAGTGLATLIGPTGMPAVPAAPGSVNPDGSLNFFDEALFGKDGKLYATFGAFTLAADGYTTHFNVESQLYRINPATGAATFISAATRNTLAVAEIEHTAYAFLGSFSASDPFNGHVRSASLDLTNGQTQFLAGVDSSPILGAWAIQAVPEPATVALWAAGLAGVGLNLQARRRQGTRA